MPADPHRDAFGRLLQPPETLPREARIDCLRRLSGELQGAGSPEAQWLGRTLVRWLSEGGSLERLLGTVAPRGSHARVECLTQRRERDALLLQLATAAGSAARAVRWLSGAEPVPAHASALARGLREMGAAFSLRTLMRARSASRHSR